MNTFITLFRKELLEQYRSKKFFVLSILFLFVAIASPIIAKAMPEILKGLDLEGQGISITLMKPTYLDAIDQFVKNLSQIAVLALIFISAGVISEEKNKKTLEILLTKPISRTVFVISKFISSYLSLIFVYLISVIIFIFYTKSILGNFNAENFIILATLLLLYLILVATITICASAIFNSTILAVAIGFAGMIIFGSVTSMIHVTQKYSPGFILSNYKEVVSSGFLKTCLAPTITSLILVLIFILLAIIVFRRIEIER